MTGIASSLSGLGAVENLFAEDARQIQALKEDHHLLAQDAALLTRDFTAAAEAYASAHEHWRAAADAERFAQARDEEAARDFMKAEQDLRLAAIAIVLAAGAGQICASKMSTQQYRRALEAQGITTTGQDVDHVFARSLGGVDHPLNYQTLDSSLNRSLGNQLLPKMMQDPLGVVVGMAVSALAGIGGC